MQSAVFRTAWVILLFFVFTGSAAFSSGADPSRWKLVGFTKYRDALFLDRESLERLPGDTLKATVKISPSPKSKFLRQLRKELKARGKSAGFLGHVEYSMEIDCRANAMRFIHAAYYRKDGKLIYERDYTADGWKPVTAGSLWDMLHESACSK
ncbi:MAG: surface-adhesin E family protein [Syntrophales bacterium]